MKPQLLKSANHLNNIFTCAIPIFISLLLIPHKSLSQNIDTLFAFPLDTIDLLVEITNQYPESIKSIISELEKETDQEEKLKDYDHLLEGLALLNLDGIIYYSNQMLQIAFTQNNKQKQVQAYCHKGLGYIISSDFNSGEQLLKQADKLAQEINYPKGLAEAKSRLAFCMHIQTRHSEGILLGEEAIKIYQQIKLNDGIAAASMNTGNCYYGLGQFDKAIELLTQSLRLYETLDNKNKMIKINYNLSVCYFGMANYEETTKYARASLDLIEPGTHKVNAAGAKNILGAVAMRQENFEDAIIWLEKSIADYEKNNNNAELATAYTNLGSVYLYLNNPSKCLELNKKALTIGKELNAPAILIPAYSSIGNAYTLKEDWENSIHYQKESLKLCQESQNDVHTFQILLQLADTYSRQGNHKEAYSYYQQFHEKEKEVFNQDTQNKIEEIRGKYEIDKKEAELAEEKALTQLQKTKLQRNRIGIGALILFAFILGYFLYSMRKKKQIIQSINDKLNLTNKDLKEARDYAKTLLNEGLHRIKNNLLFAASILDLHARDTKDKDVQAAVSDGRNRIEAMGLLHKKLLYREQDPTSIEMQGYLTELIQNLSLAHDPNSNIELSLVVDPIKLDIDKAMRIGLIVNELVTNAYKHIDNSITDPKLIIRLHTNEKLHLTVQDNGKGFPINFDLKKEKSFGLQLVDLLVQQLNGQLNIESKQGACYELHFY